MQMLFPSYQAMLGHHRSKAFDRFKRNLELSSSSKEGFAAKVRHWSDECMSEFDQGCAGMEHLPPQYEASSGSTSH